MKNTEQASAPQGTKRTMSPAARKKIAAAAKQRWANQARQTGQTQAQGTPLNFEGYFRGLISTTRRLTREQLNQQVEGCIGPANTIGDQADRHAVRMLVDSLEQATAQRAVGAGGSPIHG